jgi:hypothetical protein
VEVAKGVSSLGIALGSMRGSQSLTHRDSCNTGSLVAIDLHKHARLWAYSSSFSYVIALRYLILVPSVTFALHSNSDECAISGRANERNERIDTWFSRLWLRRTTFKNAVKVVYRNSPKKRLQCIWKKCGVYLVNMAMSFRRLPNTSVV